MMHCAVTHYKHWHAHWRWCLLWCLQQGGKRKKRRKRKKRMTDGWNTRRQHSVILLSEKRPILVLFVVCVSPQLEFSLGYPHVLNDWAAVVCDMNWLGETDRKTNRHQKKNEPLKVSRLLNFDEKVSGQCSCWVRELKQQINPKLLMQQEFQISTTLIKFFLEEAKSSRRQSHLASMKKKKWTNIACSSRESGVSSLVALFVHFEIPASL